MKKKTDFNSYVLTKEEHIIRRYIVPFFGFPMLLLFSLYLWIFAFKHPENVGHWGFASGWFLFVIALMVYFYTHRTIDEMQYHIGEHSISNTTPLKKDLKLNLFDQLYITLVSVEFAYGKATIMRKFYLFSPQPFSNDDFKGSGGLITLEHFHKLGIIIFPTNERVDKWLNTELKINDIPEFPHSVIYNTENQFGNGIDSSVGLMTDG